VVCCPPCSHSHSHSHPLSLSPGQQPHLIRLWLRCRHSLTQVVVSSFVRSLFACLFARSFVRLFVGCSFVWSVGRWFALFVVVLVCRCVVALRARCGWRSGVVTFAVVVGRWYSCLLCGRVTQRPTLSEVAFAVPQLLTIESSGHPLQVRSALSRP